MFGSWLPLVAVLAAVLAAVAGLEVLDSYFPEKEVRWQQWADRFQPIGALHLLYMDYCRPFVQRQLLPQFQRVYLQTGFRHDLMVK